jgi:2-hydroxychromene-2-carboxylate isomerase
MPRPDAAFYFDLGSPLAYLAAERVLHTLAQPIEWQPVLARELSASETVEASEIESRARAQGLQPVRWPEDFPFDSELAMLAATYAKSIGRTVPFAQAAFRQAFAGGHSLAQGDHVLVAAAACEMHPKAVLKGVELTHTRRQLRSATIAAARAGVTGVPAVRIGARTFSGERAVEDAAAHTRAMTSDGGAMDTDVPAGAPR